MNDDARPGSHPESEDDDAWRRIVLDLGGTEEQASASAPHDTAPAADTHSLRPSATPSGPRDYSPIEKPHDFVPADPPALASSNPRMVLTWAAAIGAPIALVMLMLFVPQAPFWARAGLIVVFILGLAGLFLAVPTARSRSEQPPDDDDYGGGARI